MEGCLAVEGSAVVDVVVVVEQACWGSWGELAWKRCRWKEGQLGIAKYWMGLAKGLG